MTLRALALALLGLSTPALPTPALADDLPPGWVRLSAIAPGIAQDIRYARAFNFTGAPVPGYEAAECLLRREAAEALLRAETLLNDQGYGLILWDCYRPARAVARFARWAETAEGPDLSATFFPGLARKDLIPQGYIARRSGHSLGGTVDVGLIRRGDPVLRPVAAGPCDGPLSDRAAESTLDLGTTFDCFSALSATDAAVSAGARANRQRLAQAMQAEGFRPYAAEWWHFRLDLAGAEPQDFPVR